MSLKDISTDELIQELQNRKKQVEEQKKKRIQELKTNIEKNINELNELTSSDFVLTSNRILQKPIKKENPEPEKKSKSNKNTNICPQCGLGPDNWDYDEKDGNTYCECGWTVIEGN